MSRTSKSLLVLICISFFLRLISLNQSLWLDEATTANVISHYSFRDIVTQFSVNDFHPSFYYLFMKFWTQYFGISEVALRMPSVIFSLLSGWFIYVTGKKIKNETVGFWSATFFLLNPLIVYYSQEARMYMMATCFIAANFYFYLKLKEKVSVISIISFVLTIFLSMITFYGSIFYIGSLILYSLLKKEFKIYFLSSVTLLGSLIFLYPLLAIQMKHSGVVLQEVKNWKAVLGTVTFKELLLFPLKFSTGRISFEPKVLYFFLATLWSAFLSLVIFRGIASSTASPRNDERTGFPIKSGMTILFFIITPIILGIIISIHTPLLQYFRFQFVIIFISILLALGTMYFPRVRNVVLLGLLIWSLSYLINPAFHREDWKTLSKNVLIEAKPVYIVASSADPLQYYVPFISPRSLQSLETIPPSEPSIIIIPYTADIHGIAYKEFLKKYKYELVESKNVRGIDYEIWKRSPNFYAGSF